MTTSSNGSPTMVIANHGLSDQDENTLLPMTSLSLAMNAPPRLLSNPFYSATTQAPHNHLDCTFSTGPPAAFQPERPPARFLTGLRPMRCRVWVASSERHPLAQR